MSCQPNIRRLIVVGSTRLFSRFEDQKAKDLRLLAEKIWQSKINATVIHPTLNYGAPDSNNVERVVRFCSLSPIVPVPKGGNTLIQPVSASDLLQGLLTCLKDEETIGRTIIAAGGKAISYRRFIEACAESSGKKIKVMLTPLLLMKILAAFSRLIPGIPSIHASELKRLFENKNFSNKDVLIGITASGRTPYVVAALYYSKSVKALCISISSVPLCDSNISTDIDIRLITGPEILSGSTRLKAGTATKMALNIISTSVMIQLAKVYGNRMIDLSVSNDKLMDRAIGILFDIGSVDKETAVQLLKKTNGSVKLSLLIAITGMDVIEAKTLLNDSNGNLRTALITVNSN